MLPKGPLTDQQCEVIITLMEIVSAMVNPCIELYEGDDDSCRVVDRGSQACDERPVEVLYEGSLEDFMKPKKH